MLPGLCLPEGERVCTRPLEAGPVLSLLSPPDLNAKRKKKVAHIYEALNSDPADVDALRRLAIDEGGLLTDEIRQEVWPKLLNVNTSDLPLLSGRSLRQISKDYQQVLLDVRRSLRRFPPGMPDEQREGLQEELIDVILLILQQNPQLHYYQGYHDIVVTFLLVVGERLATPLVEKLSTHHLRDFMEPTMDNTKHILNYLMPIIDQCRGGDHLCPQLAHHLVWTRPVRLQARRAVIRLLPGLPPSDAHLLCSCGRSCCTESRRSWTATATWPPSTTCSPRSPRTCPTRHSSAGPETFLSSSPRPGSLGRWPPSSRPRELQPRPSRTLSWCRPSRGLTWCCGAASRVFCGPKNRRKTS
ncbi:TBC1 domain family member 20 isoform X3 [Echinops telfairi]|uniref:TBC1 domain family member 20 isoform X3 n=1 Tax=Echinops telfairi TaxID=9371 RepID=A0AC55DHY3_ECHTE|nr:TBC1 domain family member 20 isoform X3 [Echinops telfairi]